MPDTYTPAPPQTAAESYYEDQSGQPVTQPPPGTAPQQSQGPFSAYLDPSQTREPTHTASQQRPSGYMKAGGQFAMLADQFLGGLAKGRAQAYNQSLQKAAAEYKQLDAMEAYIKSQGLAPDKEKEALQKVARVRFGLAAGAADPSIQQEGPLAQPGQQGGGKKKSGGKDKEQGNPILHFIHNAALRLAGPGAQPLPFTSEVLNAGLADAWKYTNAQKSEMVEAQDAQQAAMKAIGKYVQPGKAVDPEELNKDEEFTKAFSRLQQLDPKAAQEMRASLDKNLAGTRVKNIWEATTPRGKETLTELANGTFVGKNGTPVTDYTELKRPGTDNPPKAPTKFETDLADSKAYLTSLLGKSDKPLTKEESHVAERLAGGDKELRDRFEVNVKKGMPVETAYNAAIAAHVKSLDSKQTGLDLGNAFKALGLALRRDQKNKLKPNEVKQTAHAVINDVFLNKDPSVQAWATKLRDRILAAKTNKNDASLAAQELRDAVLQNVESEDNYTDLTDEQRKQVATDIRGMDWTKIVPLVPGAGASSSVQWSGNNGKKPKSGLLDRAINAVSSLTDVQPTQPPPGAQQTPAQAASHQPNTSTPPAGGPAVKPNVSRKVSESEFKTMYTRFHKQAPTQAMIDKAKQDGVIQ
jgi:hypothetical protein